MYITAHQILLMMKATPQKILHLIKQQEFGWIFWYLFSSFSEYHLCLLNRFSWGMFSSFCTTRRLNSFARTLLKIDSQKVKLTRYHYLRFAFEREKHFIFIYNKWKTFEIAHKTPSLSEGNEIRKRRAFVAGVVLEWRVSIR